MSAWVACVSPYVLLVSAVWLTYVGTLRPEPFPNDLPNYVSDDLLGIANYDGKWQTPKWKWHHIFKKFRYHLGLKPNPNKNWSREKQPSHLPNPKAHHRANLWIFCGTVCLLYTFLAQILDEKVAFLATLLWAVHPLGCQTVGWISGIGYVTSTFFMFLGLNLVLLAHQLGWDATVLGTLGSFLLFGLCQWMAVEAQFATIGATVILLYLHQWPYAVIAGLISIYGGMNTLHEAVTLRKAVFKEQQMGQSTAFYPRKLIVVLKTLYYDLKLAVFPKRLGLYHPYCYHYEMPYVEHEDQYGILGLLSALGLFLGIWLGPLPLQFGLLWFLAYMVVFLNWITANQFVVDRYVWLPSLGICLIAASYLPVWAFWMLVGIALMRTWAHIPTYENEEKFYQSNLWNFPTTEVAYGNLGVTYLSRGWIGSAMEAWIRGIQLNPEYDVSWYNLASAFKSRGPLNPQYLPILFNMLPKELLEQCLVKDPQRQHLYLAHFCLERAVAARTCHFPQLWQKELMELKQMLIQVVGGPGSLAKLIQPTFTTALT